MKKFKVEYENQCIMFGDKHCETIVEAESSERAIGKVRYESHCVLSNMRATEIK